MNIIILSVFMAVAVISVSIRYITTKAREVDMRLERGNNHGENKVMDPRRR
ncbi:hypothetical protein [Clostridium tetani]|uniref:hypothetical protein n=1 Tax=Clostridium tetani TaxID=1513 RepID=UPI0013E945F7|nr:hypothetical protein [Clostridium tetani]BDR84892.1 hypothetical protein K254310026_23030 [Clostridium tetani]